MHLLKTVTTNVGNCMGIMTRRSMNLFFNVYPTQISTLEKGEYSGGGTITAKDYEFDFP